MEPTAWCFEKNGLELTAPSEELKEVYFVKATRAIHVVENTFDTPEWQVSAAYYSIYFSLYALCCHVGIKSKNHHCTLALLSSSFRDLFTQEERKLARKAKQNRINAQYYEFNLGEEHMATIDAAPAFLEKCRKVCFALTNKDIARIRAEFLERQRLASETFPKKPDEVI